jgi:chromosome segregation ATPase
MADPIENYREGRETQRRTSSRRLPEREPESPPRSVSGQARSSQDLGEQLTRTFQNWNSILKWACLALGIIAFLWLCKLIAGGKFKPVSKIIEKATGIKKDCTEEVKALTSIHKSSGKMIDSTIEVNIPTESSIGLTARTWVDSHRDWLLDQYQTTISSIMRENFRPIHGDATLSSYVLSSAELQAIRKLEDENYLRRILDKLMDYANAKYRLTNVNVNSKEFNDHFLRNREAYEKCQLEIEKINREIEDKLRSKYGSGDDINSLNSRISYLVNKIASLDDEINRKNRDLNAKLDDINRQIRDYYSKQKSRQSILGEVTAKSDELRRLEGDILPLKSRLPDIQSDISKTETDIKFYRDSTAELMIQKASINKDRHHLERSMRVLLDNKELYELVHGLGKCEENKIKTLMNKLQQVETEETKLKSILGADSDLLMEIDKEDQEIREIKQAFDDLRRKAESFPYRNIEIKLKELKEKTQPYVIQIEQIDIKILENTDKIRKLELQLEGLRAEYERKKSEIDSLTIRINSLRDWLAKNEPREYYDNVDISKLESERDYLKGLLNVSQILNSGCCW